MASRNTVKEYIENGYYHIYNRGVEKRKIFLDEQDYGVFLSYLKTYLLPKDIDSLQNKLSDPQTPWSQKSEVLKMLRLRNFSDEIRLLAYCLMPNHFHLLIRQKSSNAIDSFINSLCTRYVMYFNRKYSRVGSLYQDVYKAAIINTDEQLLYLSSYIHKNPLDLDSDNTLKGVPLNPLESLNRLNNQPSSLSYYINMEEAKWIDRETILSFFSNKSGNHSYLDFLFGTNAKEFLEERIRIDY